MGRDGRQRSCIALYQAAIVAHGEARAEEAHAEEAQGAGQRRVTDLVVVEAKFGSQAPDDLSVKLRAVADAIDRGEVTALVAGMVRGNEFEFIHGTGVSKGMELATLLHASALRRYSA